jgi:hypothetical protein
LATLGETTPYRAVGQPQKLSGVGHAKRPWPRQARPDNLGKSLKSKHFRQSRKQRLPRRLPHRQSTRVLGDLVGDRPRSEPVRGIIAASRTWRRYRRGRLQWSAINAGGPANSVLVNARSARAPGFPRWQWITMTARGPTRMTRLRSSVKGASPPISRKSATNAHTRKTTRCVIAGSRDGMRPARRRTGSICPRRAPKDTALSMTAFAASSAGSVAHLKDQSGTPVGRMRAERKRNRTPSDTGSSRPHGFPGAAVGFTEPADVGKGTDAG